MPAVLIHGVPDTHHVWKHVQERLSRNDVTALSLPGFGIPVPEGFRSTKEEYVSWIIQQLEQIEEPVDLVGHDWGCLLTTRVASLRPDLIRTWAAGSGPVSKNYEFHELAKIWQTPEVGEKWMRELDPADLAAFLNKGGYTPGEATEAVARIDNTMRASILRLYRSAIYVGSEWQPDLYKIQAPGLVFWGEEDPACPVRFADELASDSHAKTVLKLKSSHWTIVDRSAEVTVALEQHWAAATRAL